MRMAARFGHHRYSVGRPTPVSRAMDFKPLEDGTRSMGRPELATVVLAVIRGLLMDLDATGDTTRTNQAFTAFLDTIRHPTQAILQVTRPYALRLG
jgi:hypothetical protein